MGSSQRFRCITSPSVPAEYAGDHFRTSPHPSKAEVQSFSFSAPPPNLHQGLFISSSLLRWRRHGSGSNDSSCEKCRDDIRASPRGSSEEELRVATSAATHANDCISPPSINIKLRLVRAPSLQESCQSSVFRTVKSFRAEAAVDQQQIKILRSLCSPAPPTNVR